jgi:hypothetical protein
MTCTRWRNQGSWLRVGKGSPCSSQIDPKPEICTNRNWSYFGSKGSLVDSQGASFRDPPLVIRRDWTIDGLSARVWDPNTNKPASYQILHLQAQPDFVMEYKP